MKLDLAVWLIPSIIIEYPAIDLKDQVENFKPISLGLVEDICKISFVASSVIFIVPEY
ncbi:MAG TPA: hypothetical protein VEH06_08410 [Candidatus Bathyarchaeia archaeon]|jgi:hypothetical protein|nr:hypothetical protein [Candidatus Bathyarchaeia archaeon]